MITKPFFKNKNRIHDYKKGNNKFYDDIHEIEKVFIADEDKSAIISLIVRSLNSENFEEFWENIVNIDKIMSHYALCENANVKNLLSIFLYDWHNHECFKTAVGEKNNKLYHLIHKFKAYNKSNSSVFKKLFEIIDNKDYQGYHHVCLRIIYEYMNELNKNNYAEIHELINHALQIKNEVYKVKVLKIATVFLQNTSEQIYKDLKMQILSEVKFNLENNSIYQISIDDIQKHCNEKFFELVFLLKENHLKTFEFEFEDYMKTHQKLYGEYWMVAIKENVRLLYHVAEEQCHKKLFKTVEFIFNKCNFIELNSTILTTLQQMDEFFVVFNEPLEINEIKILVIFLN